MNTFSVSLISLLTLGFLTFLCNLETKAYKFSDHIVAVGNPALVNSGGSGAGYIVANDPKLNCLKWHTAKAGENQWAIARRFAPSTDRSRWLKDMRLVSDKQADDAGLRVGELVCVHWKDVI